MFLPPTVTKLYKILYILIPTQSLIHSWELGMFCALILSSDKGLWNWEYLFQSNITIQLHKAFCFQAKNSLQNSNLRHSICCYLKLFFLKYAAQKRLTNYLESFLFFFFFFFKSVSHNSLAKVNWKLIKIIKMMIWTRTGKKLSEWNREKLDITWLNHILRKKCFSFTKKEIVMNISFLLKEDFWPFRAIILTTLIKLTCSSSDLKLPKHISVPLWTEMKFPML